MSPFRLTLSRLAVAVTLGLLSTTVSYAEPPEGYESFEAYETAMYVRIGELAEQGNLNISRLLARRDELRAEYAAARQNDDQAGMAEARALQAHLIRIALERADQFARN